MKLENRNLSSRMKGEDVSALQKELKQLGFTIASKEVKEGYFGKTTRLAVLAFQRENKLKPTGEVDKRTAGALTKALEAQGKPKQPRRIQILGRVTDRATKAGVEGVRVEAWDKDLLIDDLLGSATTDAEGAFSLDFDKEYYQEICFDRKPDVYFKVFHGKKLIASTEDSIRWNVEKGEVKVKIKVSLEHPHEKRVVKGVVVDIDSNPLAALEVQAMRRSLRQETLLGSAKTDDKGRYKIAYTIADPGAVNLSIKVLDRDGSLLHLTEIYHDVPKEFDIDVQLSVVVSGYSEFERIDRALRPILDIKIEDIEEDDDHDDISFLSGETGIEAETLARYVIAHKLTKRALKAELWFAVLSGSIFEYKDDQSLAEHVSFALETLSSLDEAAVRKALTWSFNLNVIDSSLQKKTSEWVAAFQDFSTDWTVDGAEDPPFVRSALDHAGIKGAKKRKAFAGLFNQSKELTPEIIAALEKDAAFSKAEIDDLQTSFRLSELTESDFSVVKAIKDEFSLREPSQIRSLAMKSESEWVDLIKSKHTAGEINLPLGFDRLPADIDIPEADAYAKSLERKFVEAFPTTAFAGGLQRALSNGGSAGLQNAEALSQFLDVHADFEFLNTPIDKYLMDNRGSDAAAVVEDDDFRIELKAIQRVFKLAPRYEAADALMADGFHSAQQVYRMGESEFVRKYKDSPGFTKESAELAWRRAADTHAAVVTIVADLKGLEAVGLPHVIPHDNSALETFPNWKNLFFTGDLCECEHCRSVLSPAAYYADILMFLKDRNADNPAFSVKDILFARRPDLGYLELNCDNALVPLPYIDVVCEVLEDVIADGAYDLELTGFTAMPSGTSAQETVVETAFAAEDIDLGANFTISQVDPSDPDLWVVHGEEITYLLKKKPPSSNFFAVILCNTKATAEELRAYPQYVNPEAYKILRAEKYPLSLPFDLFAEEVRAAFRKSNLKRWDLMRTLRSSTAPNNPSEGEIAAEYLGISCDSAGTHDEKRLILVADTTVAGQQEVWGETGTNWLDAVGNVDTFMQKTGLEYNDVLALIDLKFINPDDDIDIQHTDPTCDADTKYIRVLNATKLDRIHRFLRMWRKLDGWEMWELDLVIRHTAIGNGSLDEAFLINLFYFSLLKDKLGSKASVEHVCALFGDLNTESRFTEPHKKREEGLYQSLFLNERYFKPVDPAFQIDSATGDLLAGDTITAHHSVVLAALRVRESDLITLKGLTKPSDGFAYITDDLTLSNLSFLWRHAWLGKMLKFKRDEWKSVLALFQQDIHAFSTPKAAWEYLVNVEHLKETDYKVDELLWLLAADRSAKAAIKEKDAARFLSTLRDDLQDIQEQHDPSQYDFLSVTTPTDVVQLSTLLSSLLQELNRSEDDVNYFLGTLFGSVTLETSVKGLPPGFTFPAAITGSPNHIPIQYDATNEIFTVAGLITDAQRTVLLTDASLTVAVTSNAAYQLAIEELYKQSQLAGSKYISTTVEINIPGGLSLPTDGPSIPIRYDATKNILTFLGVMSDSERTVLTTAGNPAAAIDELHELTRLAVKFYDTVFTTSLLGLPSAVDFKTLSEDLAAKVSYDANLRELRFTGIMTSADQTALNGLSADADYQAAVSSLYNEPRTVVAPDDRIWLTVNDLDDSLPANDTLAKRLANACKKALSYLLDTTVENTVIQQCGSQLGISEELTKYLLTEFKLLPETILTHFMETFAFTYGVVDYITLQTTFDAWYWAIRIAYLWGAWKITLVELKKLVALTNASQLLDFSTLPLNATAALPSVDRFLNTSRLMRLRDRLPETKVTLLEILEDLNDGQYATSADFAADVELMNEDWLADDVESLTSSLDLTYPADFLLPESWERVRKAFYFLDNLNSTTDEATSFAAATMTLTHAKKVKGLLCSKFGEETWLTLSAEIQDVLRERKRDALSAYLLTQPKPTDAPSGKWENTNDLYAYYLLDIEMSSCMLTSRLVQASGSVQLFVQRCFMGLEPDVVVDADSDTAWRWWEWMRKYRVWEANRKVFLWPENWIEPELKKDRSQFFKDLETELLQNEINQDNVETAFSNYLEKLDGVARLEIAGFYQEDDGDETIIHLFGRTRGAEPHLYYYRRYDYRQWTPWEKVELDIPGDFLIPVVVGKRLFLFWPVFSEVPDEESNDNVEYPDDSTKTLGELNLKPKKKLKLQLAVSDFRQGKWTPSRVSTDYDITLPYPGEIGQKFYKFFPIDRSDIDGRFGIGYDGYALDRDNNIRAYLYGAFEVTGCKGVPVLSSIPGSFMHAVRPEMASVGYDTRFMRWVELGQPDEFGVAEIRADAPDEDLTFKNELYALTDSLQSTKILKNTPDYFSLSPPWHMSYLDKLSLDGMMAISKLHRDFFTPTGSWLPFFYSDKKRTFFVLPSLKIGGVRNYYPEIKKAFRALDAFFEGIIQTHLDAIDLTTLSSSVRAQLEQFLHNNFPLDTPPLKDTPPSYTDTQVINLMKRYFMRFVHWFLGTSSMFLFQFRQFHFKNFYHPFVCELAKLVYDPLKGIPAMMSRETQFLKNAFDFDQTYQPTLWVVEPGTDIYYPEEVIDFSPDGAYSSYNWELFYHAPLMIANSLSTNQRFEEAREWYHFIFNPIGVESTTAGGSVMSKYWITKPFYQTTDTQYIQQRIDNLLRMLAGDTSVPGYTPAAKQALEAQVLDWRTYPFEPHRIANYRTVAYQKTVVMKYLDNLIAWGDYLFRQDSMESINEATQLYILAAEILGPRPRIIPPHAKPPVESFNELEQEFDKFSNALVEVENIVPQLPGNSFSGPYKAPLPQLMLYFCIPRNENLLEYWDTVADRLYKIRHCMNIEGVVRVLALFEPPIDPGALVKAVAAGMDISSALADLNAPLPLYRFNVILQAANKVCDDVKALGGALLNALEKRDGEALGLLRQTHEIRLLEAITDLREKQIDEAKERLDELNKSKIVIEARRDYYRDIEKTTSREELHLSKLEDAHDAQQIAQGFAIAASIANIIPNFSTGIAGVGGSPNVTMSFGGSNLGAALQAFTAGFTYDANSKNYDANRASITGGHDRRWDDWKLQEDLADKELDQVDESISAAELRIEIAEKELENHKLQVENAKAVDEFMRSKYTNEELYQWQVGQISGVYFQSYKLAYDLSKQAERCFRFELGLQDSSYINFGYWDSLKKGLLSGEKLQYDLRRLESAYLERNRREYELTKHVSLAMLDPLALVQLRETGRCFIRLPEEIFDLDFPGHYFRRIKSVSLSLPCVVGPYTTVSCTLRLLKNSIRIETTDGDDGYPHNVDDQGLPATDTRFIENNIPVKAIAVSSAQNDSGVFELNFRDERYLPFEGAGAISDWSLELFNDLPTNNPDPADPDFGKPLRQFDYSTISDAILHIKYTSREDAGAFKNGAIDHLRDYYDEEDASNSMRMFSLRQEFPNQWHSFLYPTNPASGNVFEFDLEPSLFPQLAQDKTLKVNSIWLLARCTDEGGYGVSLTHPMGTETMTLVQVNQYGGLHFSQKDVSAAGIEVEPTETPGKWQIAMTRPGGGNLQEDTEKGTMEVEDVLLVLGYEWE